MDGEKETNRTGYIYVSVRNASMIPLFLPFLLARLLSSRRCFFSCLVVSFTCLDRARNSPEISLARPVLPSLLFPPLLLSSFLSSLASHLACVLLGPAPRDYSPLVSLCLPGQFQAQVARRILLFPPWNGRTRALLACVLYVPVCNICVCVCVCVVARLRRTEDVKFIEIVTNRVCTTCRTHR